VIVITVVFKYLMEKGNFIKKFGGPGTANGQLSTPCSIAVVDSMCIVAEYFNHRIQIFRDGEYVTKFGSQGTGDQALDGPICVVLRSDGAIVVIDHKNHSIKVFSDS